MTATAARLKRDRDRHRNKYKTDPVFREAHKKRVLETQKRWTRENRLVVQEAKKVGCACCPEKEACCLVFHHRDPAQKEERISQLVSHGSPGMLHRELAKCLVLCANCHMKYHAGLLDLPT